ncbi:pseudouridine synthase [Pectinatus sottacetonis]|uniref:pseudouridine synthase n=1 Tax=Pectinatus sottacetonis TaxID=1002795 RepID=UPI0018C5254B|nr:pseudouridine synthase [Pectinatus sottacetonis]
MERLQKYIAACGIASRRSAEKLISQGRVRVNGKIINQQGITIDPNNDTIEFDGKIIRETGKKVYIMLNKPKGYISTVKDEHNRKTIMELVKNITQRIFPIGRLDYNTEGLLLLTNDGELMQKLLHPKFKVKKTYTANIEGKLSSIDLGELRHGIKLEDGMTSPAEVKIINYNEQIDRSKIHISIHEGRNRQIRRMFETVNHPVISLKRIEFAGLSLYGLKRGQYRLLSQEELEQLIKVISF